MPDERDKWIARLWDCVIDAYGGEQTELWATQYFRDGFTFSQIADAAGVAPSTVHRRVKRLAGALAARGLTPDSWKRHPAVAYPSNKTIHNRTRGDNKQ